MTADLSSVEYARRINRTWVVRGNLADDAARYLDQLEKERLDVLREVCARAVAAARKASSERRDPKPDFYASLFSRAARAERDLYLKDHFWTRLLSAELQARDERNAGR